MHRFHQLILREHHAPTLGGTGHRRTFSMKINFTEWGALQKRLL